MTKILTTIFILASIYVVSAKLTPVFAGCGQYGGECPVSSQIVIDKFIKDPNSKGLPAGRQGDVYVDNLNLSNYRFAPGEDMLFKIVVKNTGNVDLTNVQVKDTLPSFTNYVLESGEIRETFREITRSYSLLRSGESQEFYIRVRVKPSSQIAGGITCGDPNAINRVAAWADNQPNTYDSASFCIEKTVLGAAIQPQSGAELYIVAAGFLTLAGFGLIGKKALVRI